MDISNDKQAHPRTHTEEKVIRKIRTDIADHLRKEKCEDVPVFLIDNYKPTKYEFEKLKQQIINDLPELERKALIFSLQSTSEEMIRLKVAELRSRIWKCAARSAAVGAIPVPGTSAKIDKDIVNSEAEFYIQQLGLDSESLQRRALLHSVDYEELESIVSNALEMKTGGWILDGMKTAILAIAFKSPSMGVPKPMASAIAVLGSLIAAPASFHGTYSALSSILDKLENPAIEVMKCAAEGTVRSGETDRPTSEEATGGEGAQEADGVDELLRKKL